MRFGFDDDQIEIQRTATALLEARSALDRVRENAEAGTDDNGLWTELCELGWPGIAISEDFGGQGFGLVELAILLEQAGRTLPAVPLLPTATAALAIQTAGSDEQKERWLPGLATGEISGAIGVAVNGRCEVAACAPTAAVAVLFDEEGGARLVDLADALVEPVDTIDPTRRYSSIEGPGVELPGDTDAAFDRAISAMSAELTGVASRATELAVAYVKDRKQFGTPVGAYQAVAHMCAGMLLGTESSRSASYHAAWAADADESKLSEAAAVAHIASVEGARDVTSACIQAHGGIGFTWEADPHWFYKRAQLDAQLLGGTSESRARLADSIADRVGAADEADED
ncbi:MAG: acyl-CoA/acyl-ACP dehydrogenase [Solirubrobacterales bacterium]|nr:acyl-CoA/acyl-ACP dehydrogenase [Solirubrobacterales bacterium]